MGAYIYLTCFSFLNTTTYANQPELNLMLVYSAKKKLIIIEWPENKYCDKNRKNKCEYTLRIIIRTKSEEFKEA